MIAVMKQPYTSPTLTDSTLSCQLHHGDCLEIMREMPDNSIDAICADPPAGIHFMNMSFDSNKGGRDIWVAWLSDVMKEALRVMKPGGHAFIWALPKTSHWTAYALENAGWEIREKHYHIFGSGFPKSTSIDKQIDRIKGAKREVIGKGQWADRGRSNNLPVVGYSDENNKRRGPFSESVITTPASPESEQWQGWGTATKPAVEEWILCRKPLSEKSIAANVLKWGTGGLNIDASRISGTQNEPNARQNKKPDGYTSQYFGIKANNDGWNGSQGRFPSNLLLSHSLFCVPIGTRKVHGDGHKTQHPIVNNDRHAYGTTLGPTVSARFNDEQGNETVDAYECDPSCPIAQLDQQSGNRKSGSGDKHGHKPSSFMSSTDWEQFKGTSIGGDEGGASRYFANFQPSPDDYLPFLYCSKASRRERNEGCEGLPEKQTLIGAERHKINPMTGKPVVDIPRANNHPTVKPVTLLKYLIAMITPSGGTVLDCFMGSGSTGVAAIQNGFSFIGIEESEEYITIARCRLEHATILAGGIVWQ